jgi:hypothetical protein
MSSNLVSCSFFNRYSRRAFYARLFAFVVFLECIKMCLLAFYLAVCVANRLAAAMLVLEKQANCEHPGHLCKVG